MEADKGGWNCLYIVAGILLMLWLLKKTAYATQSRWFPWMMYITTKDVMPELEEIKKNFFSSLSSMVSKDPELRKKNSIRILEIGVGTGVNFAHYPENSHLVVLDPNPNFQEYFEANRKQFPHFQNEEFIISTGDQMGAVKDNSVDAVVVTLVFCSIPPASLQATLKEILRVLAPGGKLYFMEHIVEFDLKKYMWRRRLQHVFTHWIPVWPFIFDGCCLDRDVLPVIQEAGFSAVHAEKFYAPVPNFLFQPECPSMKGVATK